MQPVTQEVLFWGLSLADWRSLVLITAAPIGIFLAVWRSIVSHSHLRLTEAGQHLDRYQKGSDMLGSEKTTIRHAGILTLTELASIDPEGRAFEIFCLLCGFLRERLEKPEKLRKPDADFALKWVLSFSGNFPNMIHFNFVDRVVTSSFRKKVEERDEKLRDSSDLSSCIIQNFSLKDAYVSDFTFYNTKFTECNFRNCHFSRVKFTNTTFGYINFSNCSFHLCDFDGAIFDNVVMEGIDYDPSGIQAVLEIGILTEEQMKNIQFR